MHSLRIKTLVAFLLSNPMEVPRVSAAQTHWCVIKAGRETRQHLCPVCAEHLHLCAAFMTSCCKKFIQIIDHIPFCKHYITQVIKESKDILQFSRIYNFVYKRKHTYKGDHLPIICLTQDIENVRGAHNSMIKNKVL